MPIHYAVKNGHDTIVDILVRANVLWACKQCSVQNMVGCISSSSAIFEQANKADCLGSDVRLHSHSVIARAAAGW
jgi:hypothetical protein